MRMRPTLKKHQKFPFKYKLNSTYRWSVLTEQETVFINKFQIPMEIINDWICALRQNMDVIGLQWII